MVWPELAEFAFTAGRSATEEDVTKGRAVFVLRSGGLPVGQPVAVMLPQYVFHLDGSGKRSPGVLIQVERAGDKILAGVRWLDGTVGVGLLGEFELLGAKPPASSAE